jgi:hypothetical protein
MTRRNETAVEGLGGPEGAIKGIITEIVNQNNGMDCHPLFLVLGGTVCGKTRPPVQRGLPGHR